MTTELRSLVGALVFAGLSGVMGACASQAAPKANLSSDIGDVPAAMQSDYESFAVNCSKCHGLERALAAPVTDNRHWDIYVAKMMRTAGSAIHPDEAPHILRFLYWYTDKKAGRPTSLDKAKAEPGEAPSAPRAPAPAEPAPAPAPAQPVTSETQGEGTP